MKKTRELAFRELELNIKNQIPKTEKLPPQIGYKFDDGVYVFMIQTSPFKLRK